MGLAHAALSFYSEGNCEFISSLSIPLTILRPYLLLLFLFFFFLFFLFLFFGGSQAGCLCAGMRAYMKKLGLYTTLSPNNCAAATLDADGSVKLNLMSFAPGSSMAGSEIFIFNYFSGLQKGAIIMTADSEGQ